LIVSWDNLEAYSIPQTRQRSNASDSSPDNALIVANDRFHDGLQEILDQNQDQENLYIQMITGNHRMGLRLQKKEGLFILQLQDPNLNMLGAKYYASRPEDLPTLDTLFQDYKKNIENSIHSKNMIAKKPLPYLGKDPSRLMGQDI
jgi:hypothetical protein